MTGLRIQVTGPVSTDQPDPPYPSARQDETPRQDEASRPDENQRPSDGVDAVHEVEDRFDGAGLASAEKRRPLLPGGGLTLRPPTRAERNASRPRVHIVFHLTDEAVRNRHGIVRTDAGPITTDQLRHFLTDTDATITVQPGLDPGSVAAVDSYEIPPQLRTAMTVRNPSSVFPYGGSATGRTDLDHTIAYRQGGPPGQTGPGNLGPLTRTEHRAKTVGDWRVRQPTPGTYLWRSPHGWIAVTTNQGTLMLGNNPYARQLWIDAGHPTDADHPTDACSTTDADTDAAA